MPEHWAPVRSAGSSMDLAVAEIADWLDTRGAFSTPAEESLRTLQAIVGFHVSHAANAAWTPLPLAGENREYRVMSG